MEDVQQIFVNEHIDDLRREGDSLRTERDAAHRTRDGDGRPAAAAGNHHGARHRLGHWLIDVGNAVAGSTGDPHGGPAGNAA